MRATIHLVSADDCLTLRPLMQPVLDAELRRHPEYAPKLAGVDMAPVLAFARPLLAEAPRTGGQLRAALAERFPEHDGAALAYACRNLLAFVQVPPRGLWGQTRQVTSTTAEAWLGRPLEPQPSIDEVVLRYLGAFGPATVADIASWSRLTGMRAVVERLAPRLRTFADERGRELFDLPDAPRPDPAVAGAAALPARVRQRPALARRPHALSLAATSRPPRRRRGGDPRRAARRRRRPRDVADRARRPRRGDAVRRSRRPVRAGRGGRGRARRASGCCAFLEPARPALEVRLVRLDA